MEPELKAISIGGDTLLCFSSPLMKGTINSIQPDGKLIVGSTAFTKGEDPSAWRLAPDGKLDKFNPPFGALAYFNNRIFDSNKILQSLFLRVDGTAILYEATTASSLCLHVSI